MSRNRHPKLGRTSVVMLVGTLILVLVVPAAMSLSQGDGAVCVSSSACPLSAINPCERHPPFALVGRCAIALR